MTPRLDGKVILVTGAASGIGLATARLIAECGGIAIGSDIAPGADLALDVTDPAQWDAAIAEVVAEHGQLDGLVSNAGNMEAGPVVDLDLDAVRRVMRVHVEGAYLGIERAVAQMRAQGRPARGSIVATSSVVGSVAVPGVGAYGLAKAALSAMAAAFGEELARSGDAIRVNAVAPGPVRTPMMASAVGPDWFDDAANFADVPLRDFAEPRDIAETIVFLLSDEADAVNAALLAIDGGWGLS